MRRKIPWGEVVLMGAGFVLALSAVVLVKKAIMPEVLEPSRRSLWALEVILFITILGAFVSEEVFHGYQIMRGTPGHLRGLTVDLLGKLFISLVASILIYLAAMRYFSQT